CLLGAAFERWRRAAAACRAEVQVGEPSREEARHLTTDRMRIENDRIAMARDDCPDLFCQPCVVRPPVLVDARGERGEAKLRAVAIDCLVGKRSCRAKL